MEGISFFPEEGVGGVVAKHECRICLNGKGKIHIFGFGTDPDISAEVMRHGDIHFDIGDEYSKLICEECLKQLQGAVTFRNNAKHSDSILRSRDVKKVELATRSETHKFKVEFEVPSIEQEQVVNEKNDDDTFVNIDLMSDDDFDDNSGNYSEVKSKIPKVESIKKVEIPNLSNLPLKVKKKKEIPNISNLSLKATCKLCNFDFDSLKKLEEHKATNTHKRNYVISFLPKRKLDNPRIVQKPPLVRDQKCDICNLLLTKKQHVIHMRQEHDVSVIDPTTTKECHICHNSFFPKYLSQHLRTIHGVGVKPKPNTTQKDRIECPICKRLFTQPYYMLHAKLHEQGSIANYICDICGKEFSFASGLANHRIVHSTELKYKCEHCPYLGRSKQLLNIHQRTHTKDYRYKCTQCNVSCVTKSNLNRHMQRHRGPVDFVCDSCNRGFYSKLELERHISVKHFGIKNHMCDLCGAAFGYRHGLMKHQRKVHKRAKGPGKPKATYIKLAEEGVLQND